jgi:hypothetical protein
VEGWRRSGSGNGGRRQDGRHSRARRGETAAAGTTGAAGRLLLLCIQHHSRDDTRPPQAARRTVLVLLLLQSGQIPTIRANRTALSNRIGASETSVTPALITLLRRARAGEETVAVVLVVVGEAGEEDSSSTARRHRHRARLMDQASPLLMRRRTREAVVNDARSYEDGGGGVRRPPSLFRGDFPCRRLHLRLGVDGGATPRTMTRRRQCPPDGASRPLLYLARTKTSARPRRFPRPRRDIRDVQVHRRVRGAALPPLHALVLALVLAQRRLCSAQNRYRRYRLRLLLLPPVLLEEEEEGQRLIPSWTTPSRSSVRLSRSAPARAPTLLYRVR